MADCSQPIGSIYGSLNMNRSPESMWLIPRRLIYSIDERFLRDEDFQMFIVQNGSVIEIFPPFSQPNGVYIEISGNHGLSTEFREEVLTTHHEFIRVGTHRINVTYMEKEGYYQVEVTSANNGTGIGGDGGIGIIWIGDDKSNPPPAPPPEPSAPTPEEGD
jgi:hypothetical protein